MRARTNPIVSRQRGAALISVMLVLSIGMVLAAAEMRQSSAAISRAKTAEMATQGYWYSRAGETLGRQVLAEDVLIDNRSNSVNEGERAAIDHFGEAWAQPFTSFGLEDGELRLQIVDLQSRFNVNNVRSNESANAVAAERNLARIFLVLGVAESVLDQVLVSVKKEAWNDLSDLGFFPDLNDDQRRELQRVLVALPSVDAALNINTAEETLLLALAGNQNSAAVRKLISLRRLAPFTDLTSPELSMYRQTSTKLDMRSEFFDIGSAAEFLTQRSFLNTRVHRAKDGTLTVIRRSSGKHAMNPAVHTDLLVSSQ